MKRISTILMISTALILSGCLYPQSELSKNQVPNEEQLALVEQAVLAYREQSNGLLPIKTTSNDTARYEKYIVDFTSLQEAQLLNEIPGTAYENGGYYQYIIINPEEDPRVKLIDLRVTEKVRELYVKLDIYRQKHIYPPYGEQITDEIYELNYEKLGFKEQPYVISPFSQEKLPLLLTTSGDIIVDYRLDFQRALEQFSPKVKEGEDIRFLLEENYPFVPIYSVGYTVKEEQPVFLPES